MGSGMFPRQVIYKLLLRQGLINFARVGTAVHCLPSMFRTTMLILDFFHLRIRKRTIGAESAVKGGFRLFCIESIFPLGAIPCATRYFIIRCSGRKVISFFCCQATFFQFQFLLTFHQNWYILRKTLLCNHLHYGS